MSDLEPIKLDDGSTLQPGDGDNNWTKPSKQWENMSEAAKEEAKKELAAIGFDTVQFNWQEVENFLGDEKGIAAGNPFNPAYDSVFNAIALKPELYVYAVRIFPRFKFEYDAWKMLNVRVKEAQRRKGVDGQGAPDVTFEEYMNSFSNDDDFKFVWAGEFLTTQKKISDWLKTHQRPDTEPASINPWELRLGGSRFFVPPISISVNQAFKAGGLTGSALRQQTSPKFNSGHKDTSISMTLYFPNQESIWGTSALSQDINFDKDSDEVVDNFLSSLRGLVAQFKYSPILPIRNEYLNRTYGITAVCLNGMTIQTLPKYPFCLAVTMELTSFNHKVFLPMLNDFNQAVRWGRFRQYMGRAAQKMNEYVNMGFLIESEQSGTDTKLIEYEAAPTTTFSKLRDLDSTLDNFNPSKFQLYYPNQTPAKIFAPDTNSWRQYGEDSAVGTASDIWSSFLEKMGYEALDNPEMLYDYLDNFDAKNSANLPKSVSEQDLLIEYLKNSNDVVNEMTQANLDRYIEKRTEERKKEFYPKPYTPEQKASDVKDVRLSWFSIMFNKAQTSPRFKDYIAQEKARRQQFIKEWEVPMTKLGMDWSKVIVQGISVSMGNNFARLQLQMQSEPVMQHIGGRDSMINVSMIVLGEDELVRFRRVFDHINGLARLEHAHGILGFLGIKNVITTLCGMKYVLPLGFEVSSIPNYPHAYNVNMSLVDFDILQQRREELSSEQEKEFVLAFGSKRNPFLRIKQLWGAFNAYPDFPLAIYEDEDSEDGIGKYFPNNINKPKTKRIIGHLDPDFYFRSFETIDDDLVNHGLETRPSVLGGKIVDPFINSTVDPNAATKSPDPARDPKPGDAKPASSAPADSPVTKSANELAGEPPNTPKTIATVVVDSDRAANKIWAADALEMKVYFPVFGDNQDKMSGCIIKKGDIALTNIDTKKGEMSVVGAATKQDNPTGGYAPVLESHAGHVLDKPAISKELTAFGDYGNPTITKEGKTLGKNDPAYQVEQMMYDTQYRNKSGRMIRAYPTYMLWLIDEGGHFGGVKLFDNFYGLQSVIDFSVHQSEDILGDTLVLRLSNLYSKLNAPYTKLVGINSDGSETGIGSSQLNPDDGNINDYLSDPANIDEAIDNMLITKLSVGWDNLLSGTQDTFIREIQGIRLKPGVRVHLRMGYSANPNSLQTVFNGTITEVTTGEIVEVVAQSDAIELAPYVNTTDKEGDSGHIDGAFNTGLWLSEPRDLMVRLLSMGSSTFREAFANATQGLIFSENKFGIRHFGQVLYEPLTSGESQRHSAVNEAVGGSLDKTINLQTGDSASLGDTLTQVRGSSFDTIIGTNTNVRADVLPLMQSLWVNSFRHRDYELFKRNIYPGNGSGVAQYLGGDFPEAGLMMAEAAGADGGPALKSVYPEAVQRRAIDRASKGAPPTDTQKTDKKSENNGTTPTDPADKSVTDKGKDAATSVASSGKDAGVEAVKGLSPQLSSIGSSWDIFGKIMDGSLDQNPLLNMMGITSEGDDDLRGFDEVSFRAQTYMKSVWDLFQLCAALLPNYIVAVRPFEDRSTVFYGKPHWLYTSGVQPVTNGIPKSSKVDQIKPDTLEPDIMRKIANASSPLNDAASQQQLFESLNKVTAANPSPTASTSGVAYSGGDVASLPAEIDDGNGGHRAVLPTRQGTTVMEMHLPTDADLAKDKAQHKQLDSLPARFKHPYYMDRQGGGRGGYVGINSTENPNPETDTILQGESASTGGQAGAAGYFNKPGLGPEEEMWYFNMRWPFFNWNETVDGKSTYRPDTNGADYFGKRVAIHCNETGKTIVACIGESGPYLAGGKAAGMSPECWFSLGLDKAKDTTCTFGFVPDQKTKLGPIEGSISGASSAAPSPTSDTNASDTSKAADNIANNVTGTPGPDSGTDASKAADKVIDNARSGGTSTTPSAADQVKALDSPEIIKLINSGAIDTSAVSYVRGYLNGDINIWAANGLNDSNKAYDEDRDNPDQAAANYKSDPVGHYARLLYDREYAVRFKNLAKDKKVGPEALLGQDNPNLDGVFPDLGQLQIFAGSDSTDVVRVGEAIWDQFRTQWRLHPDSDSKYKEIKRILVDSKWGKSVDYKVRSKDRGLDQTLDKYTIDENEYWEGAAKDPSEGVNIFKDYDDEYYDYLPTALVGAFKQFMWQNPYCRAWLVVTTSFHTSLAGSPGDFLNSLAAKAGQVAATAGNAVTTVAGGAGVATHVVLGDEGWQKIVDWAASDELCDFGNSTVTEAWKKFLEITYDAEFTTDKDHKSETEGWESINIRKGGELSEPAKAMVTWLKSKDKPGLKSTDILDRVKEEISVAYDSTIGHLLSVAGNTLEGLISAFRLQMQQLSLGLDMVGNMQRQAHVLNKVLNDSIYYAEGTYLADGSPDLLKSVDNVFTREYGEPVIEIREPFQRIHYIDSWQHILSDNIQETLGGVATVVTASSDGKYPVSVYFDKGSPTNLQVEKAVETGLYWDNAKGEGFFSFLHPLIHPMEAIRGYTKTAQGSSDELLSKRVALSHLKESLKDIYSGEIIVLGDPDIRAHDLVYIADVYERIYGLIEVEAVTHHFTAEDGFITSIVPNAVVTVNDPSRWTIFNWVSALWGTKNIRDDTRSYMQVFADDTSPINNKEWITTADLANALRTPIMGHTVFHGGASGIAKDLVAAKATGFLTTEEERMKYLKAVKSKGETQGNDQGTTNPLNQDLDVQKANLEVVTNLPGVSIIGDLGWDLWDWVKDSLLDQHGCYIQYLTKDGQPMDAGLSYAQGVAVGRFHTVELLPRILGLNTNVKTAEGHVRITTNDLLSAMGWNEIDTANQYKEMSWWVAQTNSKIMDISGQGPDSSTLESQYIVNLVRVTKIRDGDTIEGAIVSGDYMNPSIANPNIAGKTLAYRFNGVRLFELSNKTHPDYVPEDDPGRRSRDYLESICPVGTIVAVRQIKGKEREIWGRELGIIFNNVPEGITGRDREIALMKYAGRDADGDNKWKPSNITPAAWDGYLDDGQPYTINWQMIMQGYGDVDTLGTGTNDEDRGSSYGASGH